MKLSIGGLIGALCPLPRRMPSALSPGNGTVCDRWRAWEPFWWDMTAAWAAIWLADKDEFDAAAAAAAAMEPAVALVLWCERLDMLVEGRVESNRPCVAECFLE